MGVSFGAIASMPFEAMGHGGLATMPHTGRDGRRGVHPSVPVVWVCVIKVCVGGECGRGRKRGRRWHGMVQVARRRMCALHRIDGLGRLGLHRSLDQLTQPSVQTSSDKFQIHCARSCAI